MYRSDVFGCLHTASNRHVNAGWYTISHDPNADESDSTHNTGDTG